MDYNRQHLQDMQMVSDHHSSVYELACQTVIDTGHCYHLVNRTCDGERTTLLAGTGGKQSALMRTKTLVANTDKSRSSCSLPHAYMALPVARMFPCDV